MKPKKKIIHSNTQKNQIKWKKNRKWAFVVFQPETGWTKKTDIAEIRKTTSKKETERDRDAEKKNHIKVNAFIK